MLRLTTFAAGLAGLTLSMNAAAQMSADAPRVGDAMPEATGYTSDGSALELSRLKGKPTVIVFGCLTGPPFLGKVSGLETVYRDFAPKGVQFFYIYKSLAHPELNGYVQPFTLQERLLHVKQAEKTLGSEFTWICDSMDNQIKTAFGNAPNSEWVIDAEGVIVARRTWSNHDQLREDLTELVGAVENPTSIHDIDLNITATPGKSIPSGIVPGVERPAGARALRMEPQMVEGGEPFYMKLRAEAGSAALRDGAGQMYIGFHPDPLYRVHWNNMVNPIEIELETHGVTVSMTRLVGPKVDAPADRDPREFLIDVTDIAPGARLTLRAHYFACDDDDTWCKPVTQTYTVWFEADRHGGTAMKVMRQRRGNRGGDDRQGQGGDRANRARQMFERLDANGDGVLTEAELPERMRSRFGSMDANGDGKVTAEEMAARRRGQGQGGRGGGGGRPGGV